MSDAKEPTAAQASARRQRQCEDAYRSGWIWRSSGRAREGNPWLDEAVMGIVSREVYDRKIGRVRERTPVEMEQAWFDARTDASHRIQPWYDGYDGATALAARIGEDAMRSAPLTVPPERRRPLGFDDHPALFGTVEAPAAKCSRLNDAQKLRRWQGLTEAPTDAGEQ